MRIAKRIAQRTEALYDRLATKDLFEQMRGSPPRSRGGRIARTPLASF